MPEVKASLLKVTQDQKSGDISNLDFEMRYFNKKLVLNRYFF